MNCYDAIKPYHGTQKITVDIFKNILVKFDGNKPYGDFSLDVIKTRSLECLKYLHRIYPDTQKRNCWNEAAKLDLQDILEYLYESRIEFDERAPTYAVSKGHIKSFNYLLSIGCPYEGTLTSTIFNDEFAMTKSISYNRDNLSNKQMRVIERPIYECLVVSQLFGVAWYEDTLSHPIIEIADSVLHYFTKHSMKTAREILSREISMWLVSNKTENTYVYTSETHNVYMGVLFRALRYAYENGCPVPNAIPFRYHMDELYGVIKKYTFDWVDRENMNIIKVLDEIMGGGCVSYDRNVIGIVAGYVSCTEKFLDSVNSYLR